MTHTDAITLIKYIRATGAKLTDWERGFIGNVEHHNHFTTKQAKALEGIYARVTGGGQYQTRQRV